jgi:hypothetical protein
LKADPATWYESTCEYEGAQLSIYRVHFKWRDKEVSLRARELDLTHPYFVSIKDLVFGAKPSLIIDPQEDEIRRAFVDTTNLMIPFQTVSLIEELAENAEKNRIRPFPDSTENGMKEP